MEQPIDSRRLQAFLRPRKKPSRSNNTGSTLDILPYSRNKNCSSWPVKKVNPLLMYVLVLGLNPDYVYDKR